MVEYADASTLTDVCSSSSLPEVELVSIIQESLPRYKLRALTTPSFSTDSYGHTDWGIRTPQLQLRPEDLHLTPLQIEATLKYFVLCGERLTQMTHTYNDIEVVTRLLEEKERDLELAAKIGQSLLEQNRDLLTKCEYLESQCVDAQEQGQQLAHELRQKEDLLRIFSNETYDARGQSPSKEVVASKQFEAAQRRLDRLEEENLSLRSEAAHLKNETLEFEAKEELLTKECVQRLSEAQQRVRELQQELEKKTMECLQHQEESSKLLTQLVGGQNKTKELTIENLELQEHLRATQHTQRELAAEIYELQCKYRECKEMLDESQAEVKRLRKKSYPRASPYYINPPLIAPRDSLAAELSDSVMSDSDRSDRSDHRQTNIRAMQTAQYVRKLTTTPKTTSSTSSKYRSPINSNPLLATPIPGSKTSRKSPQTEFTTTGAAGVSVPTTREPNNGFFDKVKDMRASLGRPGIPGSKDLETALRRLSLRKQNAESERHYHDMNSNLDTDSRRGDFSEDSSTPVQCRSPESELSGYGSGTGPLGSSYKLPEKLQIVKPMEGSLTLHHWQRLANPHLGGLLEEREGVQTRAAQEHLQKPSYSIMDIEEDSKVEEPHKSLGTGHTYTYTNSSVMHPSEGVATRYKPYMHPSTTKSSPSHHDPSKRAPKAYLGGGGQSGMASLSGGVTNTVSALMTGGTTTTSSSSRYEGTATYSFSLGLARVLNERGLHHLARPLFGMAGPPPRASNVMTDSVKNYSSKK